MLKNLFNTLRNYEHSDHFLCLIVFVLFHERFWTLRDEVYKEKNDKKYVKDTSPAYHNSAKYNRSCSYFIHDQCNSIVSHTTQRDSKLSKYSINSQHLSWTNLINVYRSY